MVTYYAATVKPACKALDPPGISVDCNAVFGAPLMRIPLLLLVLVAVTACHTQGSFVEEERFDELQSEVSNAEELYETLGPPSVTIPRADGNQIWVYEGVYTQADATRYVPLVDIIAGSNSQVCTRLTVVVNKDDGSLSEWDYSSAKDRDYWANTDNSCKNEKKPDTSGS